MQGLFHVDVTALTHTGRVRGRNEDTIAVGSWIGNQPMTQTRRFTSMLTEPLLCLVADGMGGHAAGEEASRFVATYLSAAVPAGGDVADHLHEANARIYVAAAENPHWHGMGTTVAGLLVRPEGVVWFNVGDSRIYRYSDASPSCVSIDDVPNPDADRRTRSPMITQAVGGASRFHAIEPHVGTEPLLAGVRYLLCSDGLTDELGDDEIESALAEDDVSAVQALFERAMQAGGRDNISILLVRVAEAGSFC